MEFGCWSSLLKSNFLPPLPPLRSPPSSSFPFSATPTCSLKLGVDDIVAITQNKVLIAAGFSAAIGQVSKPFTRRLLYSKDIDFMAAFQAGGFPSTHSSSVVAAATSLALERGFSDSIFGLTLVYAGLIMYDAQGVRREVGKHARALNKVVRKKRVNWKAKRDGDELIDSSGSEGGRSMVSNSTLLETVNKRSEVEVSSGIADLEEEEVVYIPSEFKESIGHTEIEVIAGALLGFLVSIAVYSVV